MTTKEHSWMPYTHPFDRHTDKPLTFNPHKVNSVRYGCHSAPPDTQRVTVKDPGAPYHWNSRRVCDGRIKAELMNYYRASPESRPQTVLAGSSSSGDDRESLARKFIYTSSTQRMYETVQWDKTLHPQRWKPTSVSDQRVVLWPKPSPITKSAYASKQGGALMTTVPCTYDQQQSTDGAPDRIEKRLYSLHINQRNMEQTTAAGGTEYRQTRPAPTTVQLFPLEYHSNTSHRPFIPGYGGHGGYFAVRQNTNNDELKALNRAIAR